MPQKKKNRKKRSNKNSKISVKKSSNTVKQTGKGKQRVPWDKEKKLTLAKKILSYTLIAVIVCIPTILAIMYADYVNSGNSVLTARASQVVIYDADGKELFREHESENNHGETSLITIFNTIYKYMETTPSIPAGTAAISPIRAELTDADGTHTLTCYFPFSEGAAYCTDEKGTSYKIRTQDSERFLGSDFAEPLYHDATPPMLKSADGDIILPSSAKWKYKNTNGSFTDAKKIEFLTPNTVYPMTGGISLSFEVKPSRATAEVLENGETVFDGDVSELGSLTLNYSSDVTVKVKAEWDQTDSRSYYGEVNYDFTADVHSRAEFIISDTEFSQGEFVILKATNISQPQKIVFDAKGSSFKPIWMAKGELLYMVIPHSAVEKNNSSFKFTVSYGVSSATFDILSVPAKSFDSDAITQAKLYGDAQFLDIAPIIPATETGTELVSEHLFLGTTTVLPEEFGLEKRFSYGENIESSSFNITAFFTEYTSKNGNDLVRASIAGRVIYIGESKHTGSYVAVDIGLGLRVWYCNLSTVDVSVGDYISGNQLVGKTGALLSADGDQYGYSIMLTYNETLLDAEQLFK